MASTTELIDLLESVRSSVARQRDLLLDESLHYSSPNFGESKKAEKCMQLYGSAFQKLSDAQESLADAIKNIRESKRLVDTAKEFHGAR